jgi:Amt family ammonium transporter
MARLVTRQTPATDSPFDHGDVSFILLSSALVLFMVPGLAFLYAGLARRKNALSLVWAVIFANAVTLFTWYLWGYSLAFSPTASNGYIGNLDFAVLKNVNGSPSPGSPLIPDLLYSFFQGQFCAVTVAILMGAIAERGRVMPAMVFVFFWIPIVYAPVAYWAWGPQGWGFKWNVLDYAGGGPVEIGSGVGGLAYSWVLGRRRQRELVNFRPHNVTLVALGTFMLWFGWLGFNAGSAFGANMRAIYAAWNTCLAAAFSGVTWCLLDYRLQRKYTAVGLCSGTIAGLVAATPSSGYIPFWASIALGIVSGAVCNYGTKIKHWIRVDDALDLFAEHAIGGILGLLFNGLFGRTQIIALDGVNLTIPGGWLDKHWKQLYIQFAYVCACCGYVFFVTAALAKALSYIPGLNLRGQEEAEIAGMDDDQLGEFAQDYVEARRDFNAWFGGDSASDSLDKEIASGHIAVAGDRHGMPDLAAGGHVIRSHVPEEPERNGKKVTEKS